jgi:hypothetical protein
MYEQFSAYIQLIYGLLFVYSIYLNMHSFELFICGNSAPHVRDIFWLMQVREK